MVAGGRRLLDRWLAGAGEGRPSGEALSAPGTPQPLQPPQTIEIGADADAVAREVHRHAVTLGRRVCVLASGDPGFFGIARALLRTLDRRTLRIVPAPSSVALAFARLGLPWDDAVVVSAHGRELGDALAAARSATKVAVLTSPASPPEAVGTALLQSGATVDLAAVCSRLGSADEEVRELSLTQLATGRFDPFSVVVLLGPAGLPLAGWGPGRAGAPAHDPAGDRPTLAWGLPAAAFSHRSGMITKPEVRSVVLGKLALPATGVLWDVGAGSGSVGLECALIRPGLTVLAVEEVPEEAARVSTNAAALGAGVHVVTGRAPDVLDGLPAPDRAFVGGGGLPALRAVLRRLRPGGRIVATFAAMDRAAEAAELLGNLAQVAVARGDRLPGGGWRLTANNPVFVVWGPGGDHGTGADGDSGDSVGGRPGGGR